MKRSEQCYQIFSLHNRRKSIKKAEKKKEKNLIFWLIHNLSTWHYSDLGITLELLKKKKKSKHYTKIFWMEKKIKWALCLKKQWWFFLYYYYTYTKLSIYKKLCTISIVWKVVNSKPISHPVLLPGNSKYIFVLSLLYWLNRLRIHSGAFATADQKKNRTKKGE